MEAIFNSRLAKYKTPFGAVQEGEEVTINLFIPLSYNCKAPVMHIRLDGEDKSIEIPLNENGEEDGRTIFNCSFNIEKAGLYFYWFDLWVDYKKLYRGDGSKSRILESDGDLYQLTVYKSDFKTPEEMQGAVMYQIFPDRFFEANPSKGSIYNERIYRADKSKEPYFWPTDQIDGKLTLDYFGGDLAGIEQKLLFLQSLGVNWIYLNPIFEAHSNHRYNTADYMNIDPYLGTNEDFEHLCKKAADMGMKIILDGVFSHTGSDSIYFNKEGRYPSFGAWQGPASPYRDWYNFNSDGSYASWWGFDTLPECNKNNPEYRKFICGDGGVIDTWLKRGASGFRLDVADELPDDFLAEIRTAIKKHGDDKLLIGEVWEDASNKISYGYRRKYLFGDELDGAMNYPFRQAILDFLRNHDAFGFSDSIMTIAENYPAPAMAATTNHLSTHDSMRFITEVAGDPISDHNRDWQSMRFLSQEQYILGIRRLQLGFVMQFTLPGVPCVYYGDEIAMQGYKDPFNRAYYDWNSGEDSIIPLMMKLSNLRKRCEAFQGTSIEFLENEHSLVVYRRKYKNSVAEIAINCSDKIKKTTLLNEEVNVPVMGYVIKTSAGDILKTT